MKRNQYSKSREKKIDSANARLASDLKRIQRKLVDLITEKINELDRDGDVLSDSIANISKIAQINRLYRDFIAKEGMSIINPIESSLEGIHKENDKYFRDITGKDIETASARVKNSTFKSFGITGGKIIIGGLLHSVLFDESPVNKLKAYLINALKGTTPVKEILNKFKDVGRGKGKTPGIFEKHILERIPAPFERFDRATGTALAIDLKLNYAIYQGGLIQNSRPFCIERNNKVFSREEIAKFGTPADKFGGYTNKSAGEFQGKPDLYDPFTDCGGINCLHALDWVSDELAYTLRPELRPDNS